MKNLHIGQPVVVNAIASVRYGETDETKNRKAVVVRPCEPLDAVIVGQIRKFIGTYRPQRGGWLSDEDYEEAMLVVEGSVTLWLVRTGMQNKSLMVRDQDLRPTNVFPKVPVKNHRKPVFKVLND
jgi:hypothetical protein